MVVLVGYERTRATMSATNRGAKRNERDFYPTPDYTIDTLLDCLFIPEWIRFLEPCRGNGAIYNKVKTDFKFWAELREGVDYLDTPFEDVDLIITNPPFSLAQEFLDKSLEEGKTVCYLLRLNFLGSQKRHEWWQGRTPDKLIVLSRRPSFTGKGTDATEYAWFVWDALGMSDLPNGVHVR